MKHARNGDLAFRLGSRMVSAVADDMSTTQRVGAGIVAALVAISPFGAWSEVEAQADPLVTGAPVEVGPFEVTVVKVATADKLAYLVPEEGNHLLAVVAEVTNTGDVPDYGITLTKAIPAPKDAGIVPEEPLEDPGSDAGTGDAAVENASDGAVDPSADPSAGPSASADPEDAEDADEPRLPSATIFNVKDATDIRIFNPGVTYRVALVWEQSGEWSGTALPLEMVELEWVDEDPLGLDDGHWFPNEVAYRGNIPVDEPDPGANDGANDTANEGANDEAGQR